MIEQMIEQEKMNIIIIEALYIILIDAMESAIDFHKWYQSFDEKTAQYTPLPRCQDRDFKTYYHLNMNYKYELIWGTYLITHKFLNQVF